MAQTADVMIIGAGIIGMSSAFHLAREGLKVVVLEREDTLGRGSTPRATGGYRAQFQTRINVQLSLLSRSKLQHFKDEVGGEAGYIPAGYLFCAREDADLARLRAAHAVQREAGLQEVRELTPAELADYNPLLKETAFVGGSFCPSDGFISPKGILQGYADAAQALGVQIVYGCRDWKALSEGGRVLGVVSGGETWHAPHIVNAAGAWAGQVAQAFGVDLPVQPRKTCVAVVRGTAHLPKDLPLTAYMGDGFHFRERDGVLLVLGVEPQRPYGEDLSLDTDWLAQIFALAQARIQGLEGAWLDQNTSWTGLYEISPDKHLILGEVQALKGFYVANGSSGHGNMHSPAIGQLIMECVCQKPHPFDITPIRPERFAEGQALDIRDLF